MIRALAFLLLLATPALATEAQDYFVVNADGTLLITQAGALAINQLTAEKQWRLDITATNPNATSTVIVHARPKAPPLAPIAPNVTFTVQANVSNAQIIGNIPNYGHPQTMTITGGAP